MKKDGWVRLGTVGYGWVRGTVGGRWGNGTGTGTGTEVDGTRTKSEFSL